MAKREQLHFVELMNPEDPPRVLSIGTGLTPKTRRETGVSDRKCLRVEDLVGVVSGQRNLCSPNEIQVVLLHGIDLLGIVWEKSGSEQRFLANQHGRQHWCETLRRSKIHRPTHQAHFEQDRLALEISESGSRRPYPPININDVQRFTQGLMIHWVERELSRFSPTFDLHGIFIREAIRYRLVREIRTLTHR